MPKKPVTGDKCHHHSSTSYNFSFSLSTLSSQHLSYHLIEKFPSKWMPRLCLQWFQERYQTLGGDFNATKVSKMKGGSNLWQEVKFQFCFCGISLWPHQFNFFGGFSFGLEGLTHWKNFQTKIHRSVLHWYYISRNFKFLDIIRSVFLILCRCSILTC